MKFWESVQRILGTVFIVLMGMVILFMLFLVFASCDTGYEANKRVNFDACETQCVDAVTSLGTFEQGLGYVKCSCITKDRGKE